MLKSVLESLAELIGIVVIINEIVAPFSGKILEYFPGLAENAYLPYLIKGGPFIFLLAIYTQNSIRKNSIDVKYRIVEKPSDFDLEMDYFKSKSGAAIHFVVEIENVEGMWLKFFNMLNFYLLVEIKHPHGIKVNMERQNSDFKVIDPKKTRKMEMTAPLQLDGRRKFRLYVELEDNTSFEGKGLIITKIYITHKLNIFKTISPIELGMSNIELLPLRG